MKQNFEYNTALQYRVKILSQQVAEFKSGVRYQKMESDYKKMVHHHNGEKKQLKDELSKAHKETVTVRKYLFEVMDEIEEEHSEEIRRLLNENRKLRDRVLEVERQRDNALDKLKERTQEYYDVATDLEEEQGKNKKLTAQVNRDFENSSLPSSMKIGRTKIINSREKTNRKPGGQFGHTGHHIKQHTPTESHEIPAPEKYVDNPEFKPTGRVIRKQKVLLHATLEVIEFTTLEYRNAKTGQRVHAAFPEGYTNDVNYDGSVKAFAFLLGNECNVSHDKIRLFLSELTGDELKISKGMINGLCEEFSSKTESEQKEAYRTLLSSPVMNTDFTNANVNGKSAQVLICATPDAESALFIAREHKGHQGIKETPVEIYQGILVHDHDKTLYSYGQDHQECMQHNCRYIKGSEENEPELTWNTKMHDLVKEMLHYRNSLEEGDDLDSLKVAGYEKRYDEILDLAKEEYDYEPPSDYYREGYNLYVRLEKYKKNELLFLHDKRVPTNNSLCERLARVYKRKQKQAMAMRSFDNLAYLCNSMGVVYSLRAAGENVYQKITSIFERKRAPKAQTVTGTQ